MDGVEVLLDAAAASPSRLGLRSAFEGLLFLEYLTEADRLDRGAAYMVSEARRRIRNLEKAVPESEVGRQYRQRLLADVFWGDQVVIPEYPSAKAEIEGWETFLRGPELARAVQEEARLRDAGARRPAFYSYWDGPRNLEQLALHLGRSGWYEIFYRRWSSTVHGYDLSGQLQGGEGVAQVRRLRGADDIIENYFWAMSIGLAATNRVLGTFRRGEVERGVLSDFYKQSLQATYMRLSRSLKRKDGSADEVAQNGTT